ncbi:hypothetical protein MMC07_003001 [Pseudocyphellaria aurata]|nr:hypothetical protein [Pseudocyphellaria aurata]
MQFVLILAIVSSLFGKPILNDFLTPEIGTAPSDYLISALNSDSYPVDAAESNDFFKENSGDLVPGFTLGAANTLQKPDNLFLSPDRDASAFDTSTWGNILFGSDTSIVNAEATAQNSNDPCIDDDGTTKSVNKKRRGWPWTPPIVCPTPAQGSAPNRPNPPPAPRPGVVSPPKPVRKENPEPTIDGGPTYGTERERSCRNRGASFGTVICGGGTEPPNAIDYADVVYDCWKRT